MGLENNLEHNTSRTSDKKHDKVRVEVKVTPTEMPLSCPLPNMALWNMHPKVYLALDADNRAMCPYCSTHYYADLEDYQ